ncbi:hypothetical protein AAE478_009709 [Parahypoxylon ruwenzoriense]
MSSVSSDPTLLLIFVGVVTLTYFATRKIFGHDPREPPLAPQAIPVLGHMVGLSPSKFNYYVDLSQQTGSPIFTMSLPGQKMYVATKPELIQTVCGASLEAQAVLDKNVNGDEGDFGLSMESYSVMRAALKPGSNLDDMNRIMIREIAKSICFNRLRESPEGSACIPD